MSSPDRDLAEIQVLLAKYGNRLDRSDHAGWVDLFTSDGRFEVYGRSFDGPDGLLRMAETAPPGLHLTSAPLIEIDGDEADVEQSFLFVDQVTRESQDRMVRRPARPHLRGLAIPCSTLHILDAGRSVRSTMTSPDMQGIHNLLGRLGLLSDRLGVEKWFDLFTGQSSNSTSDPRSVSRVTGRHAAFLVQLGQSLYHCAGTMS